MCTIVDDCAQIESGLKPPLASPHLDFPNMMVLLVFLSMSMSVPYHRMEPESPSDDLLFLFSAAVHSSVEGGGAERNLKVANASDKGKDRDRFEDCNERDTC